MIKLFILAVVITLTFALHSRVVVVTAASATVHNDKNNDFVIQTSPSFNTPTVTTIVATKGGQLLLTGNNIYGSFVVNIGAVGLGQFISCAPDGTGHTLVCDTGFHTATTPLSVTIAQLGVVYGSFSAVLEYAQPTLTDVPAYQSVPLSGMPFTISGEKWGATVSNVAVSVTNLGTLSSCTMTVVGSVVVCPLPPGIATSSTDVTWTVTINNYLGYPYTFTSPSVMRWMNPAMISASPSSISINGGGTVAITGTNFGVAVAGCSTFYTSGIYHNYAGGSFLSCTNTTIVAQFGSPSSITDHTTSTLYLGLSLFGTTYTFAFGNMLRFAAPAITSCSSSSISSSGGTLTFFGTNLGTNTLFYDTYVVIGANKMSGTISSITGTGGTSAVVSFSSGISSFYVSQHVYFYWGSGAYSATCYFCVVIT